MTDFDHNLKLLILKNLKEHTQTDSVIERKLVGRSVYHTNVPADPNDRFEVKQIVLAELDYIRRYQNQWNPDTLPRVIETTNRLFDQMTEPLYKIRRNVMIPSTWAFVNRLYFTEDEGVRLRMTDEPMAPSNWCF